METTIGVDDAAPQEATDDASGNLTLEDLASSLLGGEQEEGTQDETQTPEPEETEILDEPEATGEEIEEDAGEDEPLTEPEDETTDEGADQGQDVLSKYNIDWDSIPEEEAKAMNKRLGGRFYKRLDKLTARAKNAEEELESYKQNNPKPDKPTSNRLDSVNDLDSLYQREREAQKHIRQAEKILRKKDQYDDDGNEYLYQEDGKTFTREQVEQFISDKEAELDDIPDRRKFLVDKEQADKQAAQYFPELDDPDKPYLERIEKMQEDANFAPIFNMPNWKFLIGLSFLGEETLQKALASNQKGTKAKPEAKAKAKPKSQPAPEGIGISRTNSTTKKQKALSAAKGRVESGKLEDLAKYFELNNT